ncbi:MAG: lysophospholipid acyltransferase family protein [Deltaproteobacteria bacterium]|nr:lysophospholipid acyltransferase family protein [Deltaproteobacteria bacterium]
MKQSTIFDVPLLKYLLQVASLLFLKLSGWRRSGHPPAIDKFVLIAAPHTSNWDFPLTMALVFSYRMKICWMGKAALFRWPLHGFFRWLGGIPIDRSKANNVVAQSIHAFQEMKRMVMVISPEGTREKVAVWKTGFYRIADGAKVPIVMGFLDYCHKVGGIGQTFHPTGNIEADMEKIRGFYRGIMGKFPEKSALTAME